MQTEQITLQKSLDPNRKERLYGPKKKRHLKEFLQQMDLQILIIPAIIHILIFSYIPMYGVLMAFQIFRLGDFPGFSEWVGFEHFIRLFSDPNFAIVMRNTLVISALKTFINFPIPIIFAVLLNEVRNKHFKKSIQTISYLPYFISWVVAATLMFDFFSVDSGAVNQALVAVGILDKPINFFGRGEYFWGMTVLTDLWKMLGWNSIIYFAAISSIDSELYEAAEIDGAGRFAKMWNITIATILPTIVLLFVFNIGGLLNANFDQIMMLTRQMGNPLLRGYADVIDTYVYRVGLSGGRFSYAAAAGLFKSLINIALLLIANKLAARTGNEVF
ncbi:MAG: sugar ABC transporter permease [Firmicutes bacterium]|nr:sugar ABC transporter permease [Bacillota bacterium]